MQWVLREAGRYILEDGDGDQAVYRLFHQDPIDHFHPIQMPRQTPLTPSQRRSAVLSKRWGWRHANRYLVRHMAAHWAACRPQSELHGLLLNFDWIRGAPGARGCSCTAEGLRVCDGPLTSGCRNRRPHPLHDGTHSGEGQAAVDSSVARATIARESTSSGDVPSGSPSRRPCCVAPPPGRTPPGRAADSGDASRRHGQKRGLQRRRHPHCLGR